MTFLYKRTVQFRDTDAAGVVYFANVLSMCHEAYEASLQAAGIDLRQFFGDRHQAIPIVHAEVNFFQPMFCGERYSIAVTPCLIQPSEFSITYAITPDNQQEPPIRAIATALTRHVCINPSQRTRINLDNPMQHWINQFCASNSVHS